MKELAIIKPEVASRVNNVSRRIAGLARPAVVLDLVHPLQPPWEFTQG
jgi:hypothetical protein